MEPGPDTPLGKYVVVRRLGSGGMGVVVLARHRDLGSLHAIKVLREARDGLAARLDREGRMQATLSHPNVVRVTDTIEVEGGGTGLVMEYVDGPTLAELLAAGRGLTAAEIDHLGRGILRGVAAAHDRGWLHRDLKPANVLLQVLDGEVVPKVADFGLAKVLEEDGASVGSTSRHGLGTRGYMPLEQLVGLPPDPRMDVFALGALLFELCEGRPALATPEAWEVAIRSDEYPRIAREDLPDRLRDAVHAALAPRASRPATAREVLALWTGAEAAAPVTFRTGLLECLRSSTDHLGPDRLVAGELTPGERAHVASCARCRSEIRRARAFLDEVGSTALPGRAERASTGPPPPPARARTLGALGGLVIAVAVVTGVLAARDPRPAASPPAPAPGPESPAVAVASEPAPVAAQAPPQRPPPAPEVRVWVRTRPYGTVTVGGRRWDTEDPTMRLPVGRRVLKLASHDGQTHDWSVEVRADAENSFCWDFAREARCSSR